MRRLPSTAIACAPGLARLVALVCLGLAASCGKAQLYDEDERGLDHPANEPAVVALARPALACGWSELGFEQCGANFRFIDDAQWKSVLRSPVRDTLLRMLADRRKRVRALAAIALYRNQKHVLPTPLVARRMMTTLEQERVTGVAWTLSEYVARLDLPKLGLRERAKNLALTHPIAGVREALLDAFGRGRDESLWNFVIGVARDRSIPALQRLFAARGLAPTPRVCSLWLELVGERQARLSAAATKWLVKATPCTDKIDQLIFTIERRSASDAEVRREHCDALLHLVSNATDPPRPRGIALALVIAKNARHHLVVRGSCLAVVARHHADGKAIAQQLTAGNHALGQQLAAAMRR